jgi:predicted metal-dependent hydrolase
MLTPDVIVALLARVRTKRDYHRLVMAIDTRWLAPEEIAAIQRAVQRAETLVAYYRPRRRRVRL